LVQEDAAVVGRKKICELYRKVSRNFGQSESWKGEERIGMN